MTAEPRPVDPTIQCNAPACETFGKRGTFRHGLYCSDECVVRDDGFQALKSIRFDHRVCFSCFRTLKTVEDPKPDFEFNERGHGWTLDVESGEFSLEFYSQEVSRDAACGFQHLTPNAGKGEKQHGERVITGTICERCGNTDHKAHHRVLSDRGAVGRLVSLLVEIDDEELEVSPETIHREYAKGEPLNLAVGRAVK